MFYEVVIDSSETANKCTILPLASRPDFHLIRIKKIKKLPTLNSPILLHHEGECLTEIRKSLGQVQAIASIDCVWRRLEGILARVERPLPRFARIPDGFQTAYPRKSSDNSDPDGGLATIEALFIAGALLGNWDATLLSKYYFGRKFVELNRNRFQELGVYPENDQEAMPVLSKPPRHALQRRRDRERV